MDDPGQFETLVPSAGPAAPPTTPGALPVPQKRPVWPMIIGIIEVVFGAFGIIGGVMTIASVLLMGVLGRMLPQAGGPGMADPFSAMRNWATPQIASAVGAILVAGLLVVAGVLLLKRRSAAARAAFLYVAARIPLVLLNSSIQYLMQKEQLETQFQNVPGAVTHSGMMTTTMPAITAAFTLLWGWLLPLFLLIWFLLPGIRAQVRQWR